jgi:hypothetical protein
VTRATQGVAVALIALSSLVVVPAVAAFAVIPMAVVLAVRAYNAGIVRVDVDGLELRGLIRTRWLHRDQVESVDNWLVRWRRTPQDRRHRWHLWPYLQAGVMLPGVANRSNEVMDCLVSLVASWHGDPNARTRP